MRIPYGKRRYVPKVCPACKQGRGWYSGWTPVLGEHPAFPGCPCWFGVCDCDAPKLGDMLKEKYTDDIRVFPQPRVWKGVGE